MRSVSLILVAGALLSQSACLLLRHPKDGASAPADTDLPATEETDPDADTDPPTDDADTDEPTADTDPATADTDSATAPTILGTWKTIPAGTFRMGCVVGRDDVGVTCSAQTNELPTHSVTLTHSFWMMQSEVTQGMWLGLMGNAPSAYPACGSTCPVETVNWWEAAAFANAASAAEGLSSCYALTGCTGSASASSLTCTGVTVNTVSGSPYDCAGYRLPTEAEWEYAARGGTSSAYSGSAVVGDVAWYSVNSGSTPHPACGKAQNGYGLCDMSGNVWEWTWDWYASTYTAGAQSNPAGPASGSFRVYRGGSWFGDASYARVADRRNFDPGGRLNYLGSEPVNVNETRRVHIL